MTESYIYSYLEQVMAELGYRTYTLNSSVINLPAFARTEIKCFNKYAFFPSDVNSTDLEIRGRFGEANGEETVDIHMHSGQIFITNNGPVARKLFFVIATPYSQ